MGVTKSRGATAARARTTAKPAVTRGSAPVAGPIAGIAGLLILIVASPLAAQELPGTPTEVHEDGTRARESLQETGRGVGMGTGARASAIGTSALQYNPANLGLGRLYHIEAYSGFVAGESAYSLGGAVVDSVSNQVAAGTSFRGVLGGGARPYSGWDWRLGLGLPLGEMIGVGLSARYLKLSSDLKDEDGNPTGPHVKGFTLDAAVRITPTDGLHIAVLGHNLIDRGSELTPMMVGGAVSIGMVEGLDIGGDFLVDLTTYADPTYVAGGGAEYVVGGMVPVRLGYRYDTGRSLHGVTGSIGYVDQKVGVDLSFRQELGASDKETQLLLAVRYHVE